MQAKQVAAYWDESPCGMLVTDREGWVLAVNARIEDWLGRADLAGTCFADLLTPAARAFYHWHVALSVERHQQGDEIQLALATPDEQTLPVLGGFRTAEYLDQACVHWSLTPVPRRSGLEGELIAAREAAEAALDEKQLAIDELQRLQAELEAHHQELSRQNRHLEAHAYSDGLTRLKNRRAFSEALTERTRAGPAAGPFALALLDIDLFKTINDSLGHAAGDQVLMELALLMQRVFRDQDLLFRIGGEEFAIFLPGASPEQALGALERLRRAVREHAWSVAAVTVSAGIANHQPGDGSDSLYRRADDALYAAKHDGRDRVLHAALLGLEPAPTR
ncbi:MULTISPECIES: sensor domain-containing diguanylate cyclase [Halomonadaceae]|uniref:diguanylate cyclase n=1 Tax=Modicisalibacter zincidurans TaxID=1178777 RepID=A0ABP9RH32_9GAMM|nr:MULTISPECIES: sensor domain-containing diguanylate cyclase [Halomonas]MCD6007391.1 sensor domain-containing diguanylate cyclase [Halomonas sp. IOP_31]